MIDPFPFRQCLPVPCNQRLLRSRSQNAPLNTVAANQDPLLLLDRRHRPLLSEPKHSI